MKTRSKKASFLAALALGAAILGGSALPSQAQTATPQTQATVQTTQPSTIYSGWFGPGMWWPATSGTSGAVAAPQTVISLPTAFRGCWGGWW